MRSNGQSCVLVDDIIDTAGTITSAAKLLVERGRGRRSTSPPPTACCRARRSSGSQDAPIREVVVTNTLPIPDEKQFDALTVLSIAPIVAEALEAVFEDTSVSEIFRGDNM